MKSEIYTEALEKLKSYCAYQERCEFEVIKKLESLGIIDADALNIISDLKQQNDINNARFAEAFTSGKHRACAMIGRMVFGKAYIPFWAIVKN